MSNSKHQEHNPAAGPPEVDSHTEPSGNGQTAGQRLDLFDSETTRDNISIMTVDDDRDLAELTKSYLESEQRDFEVEIETSPSDALERLDDGVDDLEAIVSDYDMPRMDGVEFLQAVREDYPDLPFILFTGKGSEEVASEAISNGVTDYLQKGSDSSQYSVLANRLRNSVEQFRAKRALERSEEKFSKLIENSTDVVSIISENARFEYLSPSAESVLGYEPAELVGECVFDYAHPNDRQKTMEEFFTAVEDPGTEPVVQFRFRDPDEEWPILEARGRNLLDDDAVGGFLVNSRDITPLKQRERSLEQQNERLENIRKTLIHDIRNPLTIAKHSMDLYRDSGEPQHLDKVEKSQARIEEMIERIELLSDQDTSISDLETVDLETAVLKAWNMVSSGEATLQVESSRQLKADPSALQHLLENLLRNAVDHGPDDVVITVGTIDDGIYVEDTGPGIAPEDRDRVFESGFSTEPDNMGFGLTISKQVANGHGWDISITDAQSGGARFEIQDVTFTMAEYS
ncbi:MAG: PAS domain S-box-containing protein [Natronomonas sp.]|jgi:PAS domain S-box-containing protein